MVNPELLTVDQHKNIRVVTGHGEKYGENVHLVPVLAAELRSLVLEFPVYFLKNPDTGKFELYAMLGFEPGENLYLDGDKWTSVYLPLNIRRQPFMVGLSNRTTGAVGEERAVITIDMDSKLVSQVEGEPLFNEDGTRSLYLNRVEQVLSSMISGSEATEKFVEFLSEKDLIEGVKLDVDFNGQEKSFQGMYTINEDKLKELKGKDLADMHKNGYLMAAQLMLVSIGNVRKMVDRKTAGVLA